MIKAPFNFVPLNERPYLAEWADHISQDIPFKDGISGTVKLKIEAKTPIFIGDKEPENDNAVREFCHVAIPEGKKYFIPGSSVKGMVRNVMEILSFGKMRQVQNQSFGIRDLSNGQDGLFYRGKVTVRNVLCGWLRWENGAYLVNDCGIPWRISAEELDGEFNMGLQAFITDGQNFRSDTNKTAKKKYDMFYATRRSDEALTDYFSKDGDLRINAGGRSFVRFAQGGKRGTIVFTGQPGVRRQVFNRARNKEVWSGKFFEFVFPDEVQRYDVPVPENVFQAFEFIHQNSSDYIDFRKRELKSGKEIPVFFITDADGNIESMGISYMFKYPAFNSVYNGIPFSLLSPDGSDLCECVFGFTGPDQSLKGRVQFSPAMLSGEARYHADTRLALASPHPSYYPLYLGGGQTWNSGSIRIAGRKRYPVRRNVYPNQGTDNMTRTIRPLQAGSVFEGYVRFHNLRPVELGALLSAIDFCQRETCRHSLGQGKPLGYGSVQVSITEADMRYIDGRPCTPLEAREAFCSEMEQHSPGWATSEQLMELFAMAKGIPDAMDNQFRYMAMSTTGPNEFREGKNEYSRGQQFGTFTQICSGSVSIAQFQGNVDANAKRDDIESRLVSAEEKKRIEKERQELELKRQEEMLAQKLANEAQELARQEEESVVAQAQEARDNKDYKEAIRLYTLAKDYGFHSFQTQIDLCRQELEKIEKLQSDITVFLKTIQVASINAFANHLKKREALQPITPEDIPCIIERISESWESLPKKIKSDWLDRKKWKEIDKVLGPERAEAIFSGIKKL